MCTFCSWPRHGSKNPVHKIDHQIVHEDIEQYHLSVPHYRREHAPLRRYLHGELSLPEMYPHFMDTGKMKMSYNTSYKAYTELNISFVKPEMRNVKFVQNMTSNCLNECTFYKKYFGHKKKIYTDASQTYTSNSEKPSVSDNPTYSADLQKMVILQVVEQFMRTIFTG